MTIRQTHSVSDRPEPELYQFLDSDGYAVDLTGYTASLTWRGSDGVQQTASAAVVTPASGLCSWSYPSAIFDRAWVVGLNCVVSNTIRTFRSDDFVLRIVRAAGGQ